MSLRFILHIGLCILFALVGWWLYLQQSESSSYSVSSIQVASYWFGLLIFVLFSWIFYWILHKRSGQAWMIALIIALVIAIVSTVALIIISRDHESQRQKALEQSQEPEVPALAVPELDASEPGELDPEQLELEELKLEPDPLEPEE